MPITISLLMMILA